VDASVTGALIGLGGAALGVAGTSLTNWIIQRQQIERHRLDLAQADRARLHDDRIKAHSGFIRAVAAIQSFAARDWDTAERKQDHPAAYGEELLRLMEAAETALVAVDVCSAPEVYAVAESYLDAAYWTARTSMTSNKDALIEGERSTSDARTAYLAGLRTELGVVSAPDRRRP
jgi:hypothetical protein